ncbi:uncharacterized protein LOC124921401 [Impatiens glandulifera]|uniref:uncharacterized protein LOC124921401 n=1 Tax=Impatiens glandulifera TaxID=253017 RepID=UPI001FB0B37C|nr:uncharacterized protein LOC124921401 [Impatiens glandulifera]
MKDDDDLPVSTPTSHASSTVTLKKDTSDSSAFSRGRYKFWALAAILLLAFWSMLTGTVTLRWSAGNLNRFSDQFDMPNFDDLDVLEMEDREKVVRHMWDVYTSGRRIRLPRFWQEAFEAAYEDLVNDDSGVREVAISEIAKMSLGSIDLDPQPVQSSSTQAVNHHKQDVKGNNSSSSKQAAALTSSRGANKQQQQQAGSSIKII